MADAPPKLIMFDMDDTILAFDRVSRKVWREVCDEFAPKVDGLDPDSLLEAIHEHRRWYWSDPERHRWARLKLEAARPEIVEGAFNRIGYEAPPWLVKEITDTYTTRREEAVQPFPGAIETLQQFQREGVVLALVTNGNGVRQRQKIERFGLASIFSCIVIEGEFGVGKPDDRVYLHVLDHFGVKPSEAWMVGDNLAWEVAAPQRLGMVGIWVDSEGRGLPPESEVRPDRTIKSLTELL